MLKRYSKLLYTLFLVLGTAVFLQAEGLVVQLDKPFYTAGDPVGYQLYFPASFQGQDLALKVAIYHPEGRLICEHFLKTKGNAHAEGFLKIPYDISSNTYHWLLLGTSKDGKQRIKLGTIHLPIYNDLSTKDTPPQVPNIPLATLPSSDLQINFQWGNADRKRRSPIKGKIQVQDQAGQPVDGVLSVAVKDAALLALGTDNELSTHYLEVPDQVVDKLSSEIRILGRTVGQSGTALQSIILSAYLKAENKFFFTQSDPSGLFSLQLPELTGSRSIQFMDYQRNHIQVLISDEVELEGSPAQKSKPSLSTYLDWSRLRKKIYQFYGTIETPITPKPVAKDRQDLTPDQRFVMSHYTPFDDLTIFFNEIVTPFKIRSRGKRGYRARMFNPEQQIREFYKGSPVFIVDGYLTRDANFIYNIPLEQIDTIDLFFFSHSLKQQFGPIGNSGMVIMKTSVNQLDLPKNDADNVFQLSLIQEQYQTKQEDQESNGQLKTSPNLLWLTNQSISSNGTYELDFQHSDDLGTFLIEITVQSADGKTSTFSQYYEVAQ